MTNRFHKLLRSLPFLAGSGLLFFLPIGLHAQVDKFTFNYSGPGTASAGASCSRSLSSIIVPLPTVTSTVGATITMSMQDPAQTTGGYTFNALIPAPATLSVGWLVKDDQNHSAHFYIPISIVDNTPPAFNLANHPNTLTFPSIVQVPSATNPPVADNCTTPASQITVAFLESTPPDTCAAGTFTRTWTATDLSGNSTVFTQTITINADNAPPTFSVPPQSGSSPCAQLATAYPSWLATQMANFTVADESGIRSITNGGPANFPSGCAMPLTVTFQATDNCGFILTRTATFTTSDTDAPIVAVEAKDTVGYCSPANGHLTAINRWIAQHGYQQSSDACSLPSAMTYYMRIAGTPRDSAQVVAAFLASFSGGCTTQTVGNKTYDQVRGKVTVDFLVRDVCGTESYAGEATFAAIDTLPPVITGVDKTVACGGSNVQSMLNAWINAQGNATATDDCSGATWTNFSYLTSTGQTGNGAFNTGPYPTVVANDCSWYADVVFRATDQCGNIGSDTLRFRTNDVIAPVISGFTPVVKVYCPQTAPVNPAATVTDNCDLSPTLVHNAPTTTLLACSGNYDVRFVWTATDDCGNTSTALQTFQVRDTTGPVFTLVPAAKTFRCDTFVLPLPVVKGVDIQVDDECSVAQQNIATQIVSSQNADPAVCGHYNYQITRIFTATDDCGNTRTATQVLTIVDNLGPVAAGTLDTTVVCEITPAISLPTAADACSGLTAPPVFLNQEITPGPCTDNYLLTLHWRAQDVCGNPTLFNQLIHVRDTQPPTLTGIPANISVACDAIPVPPPTSTFTATDNCDQAVSISLTETETRDPNPNSCARWTNYRLHRTWTATDNCGNTSAYTQTLQVEDHSAPVLVLPDTLQLSNNAGDCGVALMIPAPLSVFDVCTSLPGNITLRDTAALVRTSSGPITTTPVDTVTFQWVSPNLPPASPVIGSATLTVYLDNADSEIASESFKILGEDNQPLGTTLPTPVQCGSSTTVVTITADQLNTWLSNGLLTLRLAPNGVGGNAANAICPGGRARAILTYQAAVPQVPVTLTYQLDANAPASYPPAGPQFLGTGNHSILYTATDCAGNSSTAVLALNVSDAEAPVVYAPAPITAYVGQNNCQATVTLPFPTITDNCSVAGRLKRSSAILNVAFQNDPNAGWIPKPITLSINGLIPNAVGIGKLTIRHKGDNAQNGEFFNIVDENNASPDATTLGTVAGQCSEFNESTFDIGAASINTWAINSVTVVKAQANSNVLSYSDFISPCVLPLQANMTDGVSQIQAVLEYNYARVDYEITKGGVAIRSDTLKGNLSTVTLSPGVYTVKYRVTDNSGIEGMTTFTLTVRDTVKPKAFCLSKTIFSNPSGLQNYTLLPAEINNNSVDNCAGTNLSFALSQTTFTCNQAPNNFPVTLTVTDSSGNSASCTALVKVETTVLHPYYTPVCESGDLSLFADTAAFPPNVYTFMWTGPNGFVSNMRNPPPITNASIVNEGTYIVKITGITGCTATGSINVDLLNLPTEPVLNLSPGAPGPYCLGSNLVLSTTSYSGQNVNYLWYKGNQASARLLATTLSSSYIVPLDSLGQHQYFVKVTGNGCTSSSSDIKTIQVFPKPTASVEQPNIVICAGQPINLGTSVVGNNLQYSWTGPCGFTSTLQYPPAIPATLGCAGPYRLIITSNGCSSDPALVLVSVKAKPVQPQIVPNSKVCEGATVVLVSGNYTGTTKYIWTSPQLEDTLTNVNMLSLPNIMVADSGFWRLTVEAQGCTSDPSLPLLIQVQAYPDVAAPSNIKLCAGQPLTLPASANADSLSWAWTGPGGYVRYMKTATRTPGVAGQYKVVGKTSFGCADSAFVNVTLSPAPRIDTVTNNAPVCVSCNSNAVLKATISPQYGPLTYQWMGPGGFLSAQASPTIPGVCVNNNGTYSLIVRDTLGCPSPSKSTVLKVQKIPNTPVISPAALNICLGESRTLQVTNANEYVGTYTRYIWKDPNGLTTVTENASLDIGPVNGQSVGNYTVCVRVDSCLSPVSANIPLTVKPIPSAPTPSAANPILCEGETLQLFASPSSGDLYNWIKIPDNFSDPRPNPTIPGVSLADSGQYFVRVTINGCTSGYSEPLLIKVNPRPAKPFLNTIAPICLDDPAAKLTLSVQPGPIGTKYQFFNAGLNMPLGPPTTATTFQTSDTSGLQPGTNSFYVVATLNGCSSRDSDLKTLQVDTRPNITAFAGDDFNACTSKLFLLNADNAGDGTWIQLDGPNTTILNPNNDSTLVKDAVADSVYLYKWTLSNGACKNYSADTVQVTAVAAETAMACADIRACESVAQLCATPAVTGTWTQSPFQADPLIGNIVIDEPDSPNTLVRNLKPGQIYIFQWTVDNPGCGSSSAETKVHSLSNKPDIGADKSVCSIDGCTTLSPNTGLPEEEKGYWSSNNPAISFSPPNSSHENVSTSICNLQTGPNEIYWITNDTLCGSESMDTIIINFGQFPQALPDSMKVGSGELVKIDVIANDLKPADFTVEIMTEPLSGNFRTIGQGQYEYQPTSDFVGTDQFIYKICNAACVEDACSIGIAKFLVQEAGECVLPTLITPNGDKVNDKLFFPCVKDSGDGEGTSELTVFNQWGNEVFHAQPYLNDWQGTHFAEDLPPGTYYYILNATYLEKPVNRFLIIQR